MKKKIEQTMQRFTERDITITVSLINDPGQLNSKTTNEYRCKSLKQYAGLCGLDTVLQKELYSKTLCIKKQNIFSTINFFIT